VLLSAYENNLLRENLRRTVIFFFWDNIFFSLSNSKP
jgi:hypothetical protein